MILDNQEHMENYCALHHSIEVTGGVVCGECWHDFGTEENLIRVANMESSRNITTLEDVWFCPLCLHDF